MLSNYNRTSNRTEKLLYWLAMAIILLGIVLRLAFWIYNRDLIIDESNIARNLYEKDFWQLTGRLDYQQYAPVLFLWIEKIFAMLFGFSEQSLRAYPLLCGIGAMFLFLYVLKRYMPMKALWYPLLFMAVTHMFSRYSTEVKQYMPDVLIVLSLVLLALKTDILSSKKSTFFFTWLIAGSIAVWASMPSVFVLTGVGAYYVVVCLKDKKLTALWPFAAVGLLCAAQFACYYYAVLQQDAHSEYLQNFHRKFFLHPFPGNADEWEHNGTVISDVIKDATGYLKQATSLNYSLMLIGIITLIRKSFAKAMLITIPLLVTLVAASMNEFSLIPRVVLFAIPLFLILIGVGLNTVLSLNIKLLNIAMVCWCLYAVWLHHDLMRITRPFYSEQLTWGLKLMQDHNIEHQKLHVSHGSYPAYLYYTVIHPRRERFATLTGATKENWDANWWSISTQEEGMFGVIFSTQPEVETHEALKLMSHDSRVVEKLEIPEAKLYTYVMKRIHN